MANTPFATALKKRRAELSLSQNGLAAALDVSATTVSRWENGHFSPGLRDDTQRQRFLDVLGDDFAPYIADAHELAGLHEKLDGLMDAVTALSRRLDEYVRRGTAES